MLDSKTVINGAVYRDGAHIRVIGELDYIATNTDISGSTVKNAVMVYETTFLKNPSEELDQDEITRYLKNVVDIFNRKSGGIRTYSNLNDAKKYIEHLIKNWTPIREFGPIAE